ncbi:MAG: Ger(x)C family spore germination protein [Limnochordales bacterium]|nr:Ger(x)C family spore germination protein [Limnochordales bacterium]
MSLTRPMRLLGVLLTLGSMLLLAAGCWDRAEINELALIMASGIDWEDGMWVATASIAQTTGQPSGTGQASGPTGPSRQAFVVSARGATVSEAQQNLRLFLARRPRWDHASALIIGEAAAKRGIAEILDLWTRSEAMRTTTMIGLVRGKAQEFIVEAQLGIETMLGVTLPGILRLGNPMGISAVITAHRMIRTLSSESHASLVPLFGLVAQPQSPPPATGAPPPQATTEGSPAGARQRTATDPSSLVQQGRYLPPAVPLAVAQLQGTGIILEDRLVGYLDLYATRGVFWVTSPPNNAVIPVSGPGPSELPQLSVLIEDVRREITVSAEKADLRLLVTASLETQIPFQLEEMGVVGPHAVGAEEKLVQIAEEVAGHIEGEIRAALEATQPLGADVFGFAVMLNRQRKKDWERIRDRWHEIYGHLPVSIKVEVKLVETGMTIGPPSTTGLRDQHAGGSEVPGDTGGFDGPGSSKSSSNSGSRATKGTGGYPRWVK